MYLEEACNNNNNNNNNILITKSNHHTLQQVMPWLLPTKIQILDHQHQQHIVLPW
jgi:hypothetical protein